MGHRHLLGIALAFALVTAGPAPAQASAPVTPPGAPRAAGTQFLSATTVDLAWMPAAVGSNPIAVYEVYARRPGWIYPDQLVATTTSVWVFVPIGGLRPATSYELYVRARDTAGVHGPASAPVNITTLPSEIVPGPPVATDVTATTATVSWRPPAVAPERIAGYDLIAPPATPTQPIQVRASTGPSTTSVGLTGLRPGTSYTFIVVVRFTDGTPRSATSARGTVTTVPSVPPSPPSDLTVSTLTPTSSTLSWSASTPGDFPISRYFTYVNGGTLGVSNPAADVRTVTFAVSPGNTYEVYVRAVDQAGVYSAPSETVTFTAPNE
ncbi:fibronectin type III domain-containing protein [Plantactinospora sp. S1510]|uniref:Fibronectin type III domain-containing protein n=1 Tax=Plantactinospora alkalitolerans TaxID=2789879 RepID=A0ABS0GWC8_9ACTN|nr:fibronectin type III domain-containing protein [Plantactinospora alkalitolerans]MBF9130500.1 fibronectin type III domain-containing protein [Plantactinospora alkalitolerans]